MYGRGKIQGCELSHKIFFVNTLSALSIPDHCAHPIVILFFAFGTGVYAKHCMQPEPGVPVMENVKVSPSLMEAGKSQGLATVKTSMYFLWDKLSVHLLSMTTSSTGALINRITRCPQIPFLTSLPTKQVEDIFWILGEQADTTSTNIHKYRSVFIMHFSISHKNCTTIKNGCFSRCRNTVERVTLL